MKRVVATLIFLICAAAFGSAQSRVLTILVNFQDRQDQPLSVEQVNSANQSITAWYLENSYGQVSLSFDVTGWHTLPVNFACDQNLIAQYGDAAAVNAGYNLSQYRHRIYLFPGSGCGWTGSADLNGNQVWINTYYDLNSVAHELGHNLGLYHSSFLFPDGTINVTGDRYCMMGSGQNAHFNLYQKEKLGWQIVPDVLTGIYHIGPLETGGGVKIKSGIYYYYIEKRTPYGFDAILNNGNAYDGLLIHRYGGTVREPLLLDMTPETTSMYDPALTFGRTYSDGTISITATASDEVSVTVPVATPTPNPSPTVTPTPSPTPIPTPACQKYNPQGRCIK